MTGFEADLTHFNEYHDTRTIDPNLFYNPATGYNLNPAAVAGVPNRPNPAYTQIAYFVSTGHRDQTQISTALNRRFKNNFQSGVDLHLHDLDARRRQHRLHRAGAEQPVRLPRRRIRRRRPTSRSTRCAPGALYRLPWGISASVSYFYGSGKRFAAPSTRRSTASPARTA